MEDTERRSPAWLPLIKCKKNSRQQKFAVTSRNQSARPRHRAIDGFSSGRRREWKPFCSLYGVRSFPVCHARVSKSYSLHCKRKITKSSNTPRKPDAVVIQLLAKINVSGVDACYTALHTWHKQPVTLQSGIMRLPNVRTNGQCYWICGADSRHTIYHLRCTGPSPRNPHSVISRLIEGRRLRWLSTQSLSYLLSMDWACVELASDSLPWIHSTLTPYLTPLLLHIDDHFWKKGKCKNPVNSWTYFVLDNAGLTDWPGENDFRIVAVGCSPFTAVYGPLLHPPTHTHTHTHHSSTCSSDTICHRYGDFIQGLDRKLILPTLKINFRFLRFHWT